MVVTSPVITITDVQRNSSSITESTNALANAWGSLYQINPADSIIHDHILILHSSDDGSGMWDTDTYTIEFTATNSSQTRGKWLLTLGFNDNDVPTQETTWDGSDTETIDFGSDELNNGTDEFLQGVTGVAVLDESEYETASNEIWGTGLITIIAMPLVSTANSPSSFAFANDEFTFDSGDSGGTVDVTLTHDNLDDEVTPLYAELFNGGGISQATYSSNPFTTTLTDGYYLHLYIEMPYDSDYTDGNPVAVRRIDMTQN